MAALDKWWRWVREKAGVRSWVGLAFLAIQFVPDWQGRIEYWKDLATKMAHASWFPTAIRIVIFLVGVMLIVWDAVGKRSSHHIKIIGIQSAFLSYHSDHGRYDLESHGFGGNRKAYLVDVINVPAPPRKKSKGAGKVRAQITVNFRERDFVLAPLAWCGEHFSAVEIEPGETRQAILALAEIVEGAEFWHIIVNRRSNATEAISTHPAWDVPFGRDGTFWVELVSCESGSIIAKTEIRWECSFNPPMCGPTSIRRLL